MFKHTPGPWSVGDKTHGGWPDVKQTGFEIYDSYGQVVAEAIGGEEHKDTIKNAKLIASSPMLLKALINSSAIIKTIISLAENKGYNEDWSYESFGMDVFEYVMSDDVYEYAKNENIDAISAAIGK